MARCAGWRIAKTQACGEADMNEYTISIERRPHYLYVAVTGENTAATIERYMKEISEACRRLGMLKVLVVGNLQGPAVDMLELYKVVTTASDEAIGSGIRAAYV